MKLYIIFSEFSTHSYVFSCLPFASKRLFSEIFIPSLNIFTSEKNNCAACFASLFMIRTALFLSKRAVLFVSVYMRAAFGAKDKAIWGLPPQRKFFITLISLPFFFLRFFSRKFTFVIFIYLTSYRFYAIISYKATIFIKNLVYFHSNLCRFDKKYF